MSIGLLRNDDDLCLQTVCAPITFIRAHWLRISRVDAEPPISAIPCQTFQRLVVGDITNFSGNEAKLQEKGVQVDILEDPAGIAFFAKYLKEKANQHLEDAQGPQGLAGMRKAWRPRNSGRKLAYPSDF